jgi:HAD superfamily hydrolase (TIGR01549 family)
LAVSLATVFLDAGGVLVFPNWTRISNVLASHGIHVTPQMLASADHLAKHELDHDSYIQSSSDNDRWLHYFELIFKHAGIELSARTQAVVEELRAYHQAHNLWELVPEDVRPALTRLRNLGLRLVVVSNANGTLAAAFQRLGLAPFVDFQIDSHDEGVEKPDPRLFQIALERAGAHAATTIHVGDIYHVDVVGARAAGIRAVLLDAADLYGAYDCHRVRSLEEFVEYVVAGTP